MGRLRKNRWPLAVTVFSIGAAVAPTPTVDIDLTTPPVPTVQAAVINLP